MRRPPKEQLQGAAHKLKHYVARVEARDGRVLSLTVWPWSWRQTKTRPQHEGWYSTATLSKMVTSEGSLHVGAPTEVWTWTTDDGKERVHLKSLWVSGVDKEGMAVEAAITRAHAALASAMREAGVSKAELARKLRTSPANVTLMLRLDRNLTVKTIAKVLAACGMEISFVVGPLQERG